MSNNVRVVCRFRPPNQNEIDHGHKDIIEIDSEQKTVKIHHSEGNHNFTFDRTFPPGTPQKIVYDDAAKPVVEDIMKGYNGTIFVYGQTGSGKTFTMQGPSIDDQELKGIIPRMISTIFEGVMNADENIEFLVKASYLEIYMEKIRDLLDSSKTNLKVREEKTKGIWVEGATEVYVSTEQDVLDVIRAGSANRAIAETKMNSESSRSHSIFILSVNQKNLNDLSNKTGKLYLVDLAGSEKVEKTGAQGTTLDEAKTINKSLSALGNVINSLTDGKSQHIPYRDSKLTRVLQESLGGNSRTTLIINCSPSSYNQDETISTLRFGMRAKSIQNKAKVNAERSVAELKLLLAKSEKEIARLTATIAALSDEIRLLKGGEPPSTKIDFITDENFTLPSGEHASLPNVVRLQDANKELEDQVKLLEDEKQKMQEALDEFREKVQDISELTSLRQEIAELKMNEENLSKENELLIIKMADITIENEKLQYENSELSVQLEKVESESKTYQEERDNLQKTLDMINERQKSSKISSLLSIKKDQEKEEVPKPQGGLSLLEEIEIAVTRDQEPEEPTKSSYYTESLQGLDIDDLEHATVEALRTEIKKQKVRISQLERENELQKKTVEQIQKEHAKITEQTTQLEALSNSGDQNQREIEFNTLKAALFKDLENRCQKVVELEMLLDEARDQYQSLLVQVKNSNTSALQRKCIFLQKNLEQLTKVQQELVNENNRLKIDAQVNIKQIAVRNERIHGLELLLQDAQAQLQKQINGGLPIHRTLTSASRTGQSQPTNFQTQARIAKPLRGGGGKSVSTNSPSTPSATGSNSLSTNSPVSNSASNGSIGTRQRSSSIWDLFKGSKKEETNTNNGAPPLPQTPTPLKTPSPKPPARN